MDLIFNLDMKNNRRMYDAMILKKSIIIERIMSMNMKVMADLDLSLSIKIRLVLEEIINIWMMPRIRVLGHRGIV